MITETVNSAGNLHLSLINNVFSDEECSNLIIYSENVGYVQASSYIDKYKKEHFFLEIRKSLRCEISITPKIGLICLMDQNILHEVPKLVSGIKYVIRTELMYK